MAVIKVTFGEGGANLSPRGQGQPSLQEVLRDIADDLAGMKAATPLSSPTAVDLPTCIALAEEMRTVIDAAAGYTILTTKG